MATFGNVECESYTAGADLTGKRYYAVKKDAGETVTLATDPDAAFAAGPIGILQNGEASGRAVAVGVMGESKAIAGDDVTIGHALAVNSVGALVDATSGDIAFARAQEAAADTEVFRVTLLTPWRFTGAN